MLYVCLSKKCVQYFTQVQLLDRSLAQTDLGIAVRIFQFHGLHSSHEKNVSNILLKNVTQPVNNNLKIEAA